MTRRLPAVLLALAALAAVPGPASAADTRARLPHAQAAASLRAHVEVAGELVTLGDVFDGLDGAHAETPLFHAPKPGGRLVLEARYLLRVARAYRVNWRPVAATDRIEIERASNQVEPDQVSALVREALGERGVGGEVELVFEPRSFPVHLPVQFAPQPRVDSLNVDSISGSFTAKMSAPAGHPQAHRFVVSGRYHRMVPVPVMEDTVSAGDIIGTGDVTWLPIRENRLTRWMATDLDQVVGKTPRRPLRAGAPVRLSDLKEPELVARRATVLMTYRSGNLLLSTKGQAMEGGARGDTVRVMNVDSRKVVHAVVVGPSEVEVLGSEPVALN